MSSSMPSSSESSYIFFVFSDGLTIPEEKAEVPKPPKVLPVPVLSCVVLLEIGPKPLNGCTDEAVFPKPLDPKAAVVPNVVAPKALVLPKDEFEVALDMPLSTVNVGLEVPNVLLKGDAALIEGGAPRADALKGDAVLLEGRVPMADTALKGDWDFVSAMSAKGEAPIDCVVGFVSLVVVPRLTCAWVSSASSEGIVAKTYLYQIGCSHHP